jgi:hypothetical protein
METIQFHANVDQEQVIRPPNGVTLPRGEIEVTVRSVQAIDRPATNASAATRDRLLALAAEAEREGITLPRDMAERHDFYAHGKPGP